jgi:hypothetical protein
MLNVFRPNGRLRNAAAFMSLLFVLLTLFISGHSHNAPRVTSSSGKVTWSHNEQLASATDCSLCDWLIVPGLLPVRLPNLALLLTPIFVIFLPELPAPCQRRGAFHSTRGPPVQPVVA